ncbi:phosphoenolpyruvate carboxylase [Labrys okinawensis]|uniref:Phosphoenolpyruvate carboxylase n=1 Tax=Labrys okinawensis TaxID=346911 RepID=A0A2S9QC23_9HYPH|nr:phosphoenolpyruvate carboxylase [Labrys okinawensis]PRH86870.1 phosphoenolpyruvate carboxylase [Labrys okinawensis]
MDAPLPQPGPDDRIIELERFCRDKLDSARAKLVDEPRYNPVAQLAFELSRELEAGRLTREDFEALALRLSQETFSARAKALRDYVGPLDMPGNRKSLRRVAEHLLATGRRSVSNASPLARTQLGIVFTGHPTFLLSSANRARLARMACGSEATLPDALMAPDNPITLQVEHGAAMVALDAAKTAIGEFARVVAEVLRERRSPEWRTVTVGYAGLGTWIGYDLDGRTDIQWIDSFRFRLAEKQHQIDRYLGEVLRIAAQVGPDSQTAQRLEELTARIERTRAWNAGILEAFGQSPLDRPALRQAADLLTARHPDAATSVRPYIALIDIAIADAPPEIALDLVALRSEMLTLGFGVGEVHMRINATQLHNAMRQHLDIDSEENITSRSMLERLATFIRDAQPVSVNFGSLDIEQKTALRQFVLAAQILKHIDQDSSIRLLIAECEAPATVMAAVYFARLFGVEDKLDVSPLFETPTALEGASRFFDVLFGIEEYRQAVRRRGRLAIQTGFSDSGRFMGQITAALAIERLHGQLARACERHRLTDVEVLIFDTHGESAGRGAHQGNFEDRAFYVMSPWARREFESRGIALKHEISFQGGDGFVYFETPELALATLTRMLEAEVAWREQPASDDPFYSNTTFSFDFFRRLASFHSKLLDDHAYHRALGSFAQGLLNETGSRKSRRQFDVSGGEVHQVRRIRAIPHNAILQQLGHPATVIAGFGTALRGDEDRFIDTFAKSDRLRRLTSHVVHMKRRSSIKALAAFSTLFDRSFWSTRPYAGAEPHLAEPCLFITQLLEEDDRAASLSELAVKLRLDAISLHRLLDLAGQDLGKSISENRERLDMLQAVRLALLQHILLMAARVPKFSTRNDVSREDIMELIFSLRIPEAVALLRDAYPVNGLTMEGYSLAEPFTYPGDSPSNYAALTRNLIDPIERTYRTILAIGAAIALEFGAHG